MSFSCGCDDSDWGVVTEYTKPWDGTKTIKCKECGCEIAPGHTVNTTVMAEFREEPFEDMSEEELDEVLLADDTDFIHTCEKCADLADSVTGSGMCYYFGELWSSYFEWLEAMSLPVRTHKGRRSAGE